MRITFLFVLFLVACSSEGSEFARGLPDSLGWRFVHLDSPGLSFRYPTSRVRSVIDRWSSDCVSTPPVYGEGPDTLIDGTIIVSSAPARFDSVSDLFGFERGNPTAAVRCDKRGHCSSTLPWQPKQGNAWWGDTFADSFEIGAWRGLVGTMTTLGYFTDIPDSRRSPNDDPNATFPKESLYQTRFFAVTRATDHCAVVISWRGHPVSEYQGGPKAASWDSASLQHMFRTARIRSGQN